MNFLLVAKSGRTEWLRIGLFVIALSASVMVATVITDILYCNTNPDLVGEIAIEGLAFLIVVLGAAFAIRPIHCRNFASLNGSFNGKEFIEGIAVWGVLVFIGSIINQQAQWQAFLSNDFDLSFLGTFLIVIPCIGIQAYAEELVFRGYLFQTLSLKIKNLSLCAIVCSSLFGILHVQDGLAAIIGTAIFGCVACYIVLRRNNLAFVSGMHLVHNFFFVYVFAAGDNQVDEDFLKFDLTEYVIFLSQMILLYLYFKIKDFTNDVKIKAG